MITVLVKSVISPLTRGIFRAVVQDLSGSPGGNVAVTTDVGSGDFYWVLTTSATQPSIAQVKAGQDHLGASASASGTKAVTSAGAQSDSATGLTAATTYYPYFVHVNIVDSDVLAGTSDTT